MTRLTIRVRNSPVRRVLTDYLPLSDYSRLLWGAETEVNRQGANTQVLFRGPVRRRPSAEAIDFPELDDFADGETAFVNNTGKQGAVAAALRFIDRRGPTSDRGQLRWALLFLGQEGDEAGIPALLRYLEYCYTHCGVMEESYPLVKALRLIGEPAARACLAALRTESVPLRRRLLCEALAGIRGQAEARQAVDAELRRASTEAERVNWLAARQLIPELPAR